MRVGTLCDIVLYALSIGHSGKCRRIRNNSMGFDLNLGIESKVPKHFQLWMKKHVMVFYEACNGILLCV